MAVKHPAPKPAPKPVPHPAPKPVPKPPPPLTQTQQSAFDLMNHILSQWGLGTLANDLRGFIVKGDTSADTLSLALSQTQAYKQRFAANAIRAKQGLPELTPAEYIGLEDSYSKVLRAYGLPKGFYDSHADFTKLIGNDVDPTELQDRAQVAHDYYMAAPQETKDKWAEYGFAPGDVIAGLLDPDVATQVIKDRGLQVGIGGAAAKAGFDVKQGRAQQFQQAGVTLEGAQKAYQQIASSLPTDQLIAQRFGQHFGLTDEENDLLLGDAKAGQQRSTMYDEERSLFNSGSGADANSIGVSQSY